jgi:hypothetical protein
VIETYRFFQFSRAILLSRKRPPRRGPKLL